MLSSALVAPLLFFFAGSALAAPANLSSTSFPEGSEEQNISILTPAQVAAFKPFTHFAGTAYCDPARTLAWDCGANCRANSDFIPTASGGDGSTTQYWYVGYSPSHASVIVGYQGTDPEQLQAILTDLNIAMTILDPLNFPGMSPTIRVHLGFYEAHARSSTQILVAVRQAIARHGAQKVTTVGHSLGGALALLGAVFLPLHIPNVTVEAVMYGMPRVGNCAFADYVNAHLSVKHGNNKQDPIPILPGMFLGFHYPSGEVYIFCANDWADCPGQDNPSTSCVVGAVPNIFAGKIDDHSGPYDGLIMDC
ncbi:lipase class 3 family protein [Agrocybe pediades]|nr:lipase class 3 family protein [Agrocybe pediades]